MEDGQETRGGQYGESSRGGADADEEGVGVQNGEGADECACLDSWPQMPL